MPGSPYCNSNRDRRGRGRAGGQTAHGLIHRVLQARPSAPRSADHLRAKIVAAVDARRVAQSAIGVAVREARAAKWSWDRISAALGGSPNGETLRRNFGEGENR